MLRAPTRRLSAVLAASFIAIALVLAPGTAGPAAATSLSSKVVIIVGPTGSLTSDNLSDASTYAAVARKYTSNVLTVLTPHATWAAVKSALQGANVVVYLGHGNGFPSPYSSTLNRYSMDGFGLNAYDGSGNTTPTYYGEYYIANQVRLAPNAVVILNHLCYASGNNEWGTGIPTLSVAKQRVDNFAAGFVTAGARTIIADGVGDASYYIDGVFSRHSTVDSLFRNAPNRHNNYVSFASTRSPGLTALMDVGTYSWVPDGDPYWRSMVSVPPIPTDAAMGRLMGRTNYDGVNVRTTPSTSGKIATTLPYRSYFTVTGAFKIDSSNRTWAPVRLVSGVTGYSSTAYATFTGSAQGTASLTVRSAAYGSASVVAALPAGARFFVTGSATDGLPRTWLAIRMGNGSTGWVAAWYTAP